MSVRSPENRQLLTNLLAKHPLRNIDAQSFENALDSELERIHNNRFKYKNNLLMMNKEILAIFQAIASNIMSQQQQQRRHQHQQHQRVRPGNKVSKQDIFEHRLKEKQESFDKLIKKEAPKDIDFTDKQQDEPMQLNTLDSTMAQRERELNAIMQTQQKNQNAEAWIKGESAMKPEQNSVINLKIDKDSSIKLNPIEIKDQKPEKRVTFKIEERSEQEQPKTGDFFSKLKTKGASVKNDNFKDDSYKALFEKMIDNQLIMIKLLKGLNKTESQINEDDIITPL